MAFIKVGVVALRSPTGECVGAEPIYKEVNDDFNEEIFERDLTDIFAKKFLEYKKQSKNMRA